ncbi:MAG: sporulation protein YunB [Clostridia bacterium]|nr:sporulation protein YunB [Clostridia bacterium]MBQ7046587.1 sporulation protein YunB [Oscillospiraceae bacterium]
MHRIRKSRFFRRNSFGRHSGKGIIFKFVCVMIICSIFVLLLDARFRPAIHTVAQTRAQNIAVSTVDNCINNLLSQDDVSYESLVDITTDDSGNITSIQTNSAKINKLKASIALAVDERIAQNNSGKISIPFGTVSGIDLLAGMGPNISVDVQMTGSSKADFANSFISAGINQTQHRIMLTVTTKVYIFLAGNESFTELRSEYCVAETIIVGEVPNVMAQITSPQEIPQK